MLLMIDNYDSFTFNLVQYFAELGADLEVYRNDTLEIDEVGELAPEGIVLSPGPGRPEHAGLMNDIIREYAGRIPMLGVCLGHQGIAQVFGGNIGYAPKLMHGKTSEIRHTGSVLFREVPSPFTATRYHSLIVDRSSLPDCFKITAETDDSIIMGIEHRECPLYGVQFHPESIMTQHGKTLLANFLETLS